MNARTIVSRLLLIAIFLGGCKLPMPDSKPTVQDTTNSYIAITNPTQTGTPFPKVIEATYTPPPIKSGELNLPDPSQAGITTTPISACKAVENGLAYLINSYNAEVGLLYEAPHVAPNKFWLTNDNALAAYVLGLYGKIEMSSSIRKALDKYGHSKNHQIEVIWGEPISITPYPARPERVRIIKQFEIWQEYHDQGDVMGDWEEYANLALLGVMHKFQSGEASQANDIYQDTIKKYDGIGFADKGKTGEIYATYKLALALFVGSKIKANNPHAEDMLQTMLAMQANSGGFYTDYSSTKKPSGDTNTETTSMVLLALYSLGCR